VSAIVVGVDGSDEARRALEWALTEARTRGAPVRVVHAYPEESSRGEAELIVNAEVASCDTEGLEVVREAVGGPPVRVLLDAGRDADLLVVGSRGRHGFPGLLLGSVSQQVANHAACPVVIVPAQRPPR
jgi:nucleotide-binding universal stress UspA family protein